MLNDPVEQTIIIAENDSMMRGILRSVLVKPRRALKLASDGDEAVQVAAEERAALVLLDLKMPRMDGVTACRLIRTLPGYTKTPIVILTGLPNESQRQAAMRLGAEFWTKPIAIGELRNKLAPLIAKGQCEIDQRAARS
jgi:CheY-like chemotaxis protein